MHIDGLSQRSVTLDREYCNAPAGVIGYKDKFALRVETHVGGACAFGSYGVELGKVAACCIESKRSNGTMLRIGHFVDGVEELLRWMDADPRGVGRRCGKPCFRKFAGVRVHIKEIDAFTVRATINR